MPTKFKSLMREYNYTQTALSKKTGVSQSNLSIYCNYITSLEASTMVTRLRLSKAFDMTVKEFEERLDLEPAKRIASNKQTGNYELREVK